MTCDSSVVSCEVGKCLNTDDLQCHNCLDTFYPVFGYCTSCTTIIGVATCNTASGDAMTCDVNTYYKDTLTTCRECAH